MLRLQTGRTEKTELDKDIPVLVVSTNMLSTEETVYEQEARDNYDEAGGQECNSYLPELYALANHVDENETNIPDLSELNEKQFGELDCRQAVTSVGERNSAKT